MTCDEAREWMQDQLDGELRPESALDLGRHLAACAACDAFWRDLQGLHAQVSRLPAHPQEGQIVPRVLERFQAELASPRGLARPVAISRRGWAWIGTAAAAILIAAFVLRSEWSRDAAGPPRGDGSRAAVPAPVAIAAPAPTDPDAARREAVLAEIQAGRALLDRAMALQYDAEFRRRQAMPDDEREREDRRRKEERDRADRLRSLQFRLADPATAAEAAAELARWPGSEGDRLVWSALATAVQEPSVGPEIIEGVASVPKASRLVPVFIAALGRPATRQIALTWLRDFSGEPYGPNKEHWLAWWARTQGRRAQERG
jgi:predicted anti-sigma-YlaC factor YlaD